MLALVVVIGAALALRLHDLSARSLWVDELFSVGLAAQSLPTILAVLYGEEANMTLYYLGMFSWVRLTGPDASEFWVRLPSVLLGAAGVLAMYRLGMRFGGRIVGLSAAVLLAANAYHVEMSQEARAYTLWALCITLSWDGLIEALDSGRRAAWLRYVVWTALAFYAHFFTLFVIAAQCLVVAIRFRMPEWRALALSGIGVAALCLPFLPFFIDNHDGGQILHVRRSDLGDLVDLFRAFAGSTDLALAVLVGLGGLGLVLSLRAAIRTSDRAAIGRALAPLLWLTVPVLLVLLVSYVKPLFRERYLFGAMPAAALIVAIGVGRIRWRAAQVGALVIAAVLLAMPISRGLSIRQDENWRAAVTYLETTAEPDDGWIFISKRGQIGYEYYAGWLGGGRAGDRRPDILEPFDWYELAATDTNYRPLASGTSRLPEFTARHRRVWLVLSHEFDSTFDGDVSEAVRDWLTRRGYGARQRTFQNIRLLLYERRA
jgi:mannosyltransferase